MLQQNQIWPLLPPQIRDKHPLLTLLFTASVVPNANLILSSRFSLPQWNRLHFNPPPTR